MLDCGEIYRKNYLWRSSTLNVDKERATMLAKSLGTLAMVYAVGELQNPLPP